MANESFANSLVVEVAGRPLPDDVKTLLTYAYVDDSRNLPDLFVLRFRDPGHVVLAKGGFAVGTKVDLKVQTADPGGPQPLMSGEITAVGLDLDRTGTFTEVRGYDHAHRLFRGRRVAVYPNMTVADVVRKVAQRAGIAVGTVDAVRGVGGRPHTQFSQDNVSDWEFLSRLANAVGAQIAVLEGKLHFRLPEQPSAAPDTNAKAHTDPLVLEAHRTLISLRAGVTAAEQVPEVQVRGWDVDTKQAVTATATPTHAGIEVPGADPIALAKKFGSPPLLAAAPHLTQAEATAAADALAAQFGSACVELSGVAKGNPKLRAGVAVTLANVGEPFAGKYTLTSTRHLFSGEVGYTTEFAVSGRQERSLYGLATGGQDQPSVHGGLVPAIVSDARDPAKLGRLKLTFPWLDKGYTSNWARVAQLGAGKARGALVLPEVGDEVLVGFEHGNFDAPYVLGGLHNGKDTVPSLSVDPVDGGTGEIAVRGFVSRKGHKLELVEADGITIASGDGKLVVKLDQKNQMIEVTSGKGIAVKARNGVTVDAGSGPLELKGQKVTVESASDVAVSANASMKLSGTAGVQVEGATVAVTGQGQAELTASGAVTVRGSLVRIN
ncbi:MAG TPA: VgrG-related protein [Actinophytocola sp.]|uniref:VgrG-related protein n=1 Tax=Actinophytocola sp. TaxID=1872138 RepID=UPI002DDCDAB0|nr:VgrG-related protein [Actinophytocola sp.]HEV2783965.1 VgrG-related protein [Actinophytocola sp.]